MKKTICSAMICLAAVLAVGTEDPAAEGVTPDQAAAEAALRGTTSQAAAEAQDGGQGALDATAVPDDGTDEIDLEEDDAASAAKKTVVTGDLSDGEASLVDIECDEATLSDILRQFRKTTGANIIFDDATNLEKRISVSLHHVPWFRALSSILNTKGFRIEDREGIYRVVEDVQTVPVSTCTFTLNHASAKELAELFNSSYGRKDQTGRVIQPIATCFDGANVVVVTAPDKVIADCEAIIKAVDKAVAQIYIEARFIELSNEAMHKLGIQWNSLESWGASVKELSGGIEYNNGRFGKYSAGYTTSAATETTAATKTKVTVVPDSINMAPSAGRQAEDMSWRNARGFSGQLSFDDFRLAMSAFETMNDVKIFSNPKVIVANGKEATVDMTTKFPNIELASQRNTSSTASYLDMTAKIQEIPGDDRTMFAKSCFYSWGIQLSVKPRISPDGLISVEIIPTISQLDKDVTPTGFYQVQNGDNDSSIGLFPIISIKRITTEFTMRDGSTAVIGGLSKTTEEDIDSGIPYLRKIPWIGPKLFGWKSRGKVQKEILVCVTVGIADPGNLPKDVGLPKNAVLGREYVRGTRLEPGDREGTAAGMLALDLRPLDAKERAEKPARGTVKVTVVK